MTFILIIQILAIIKIIDKWVNIHMYLLFSVNNLMLMSLPSMAAVHEVPTVKILTKKIISLIGFGHCGVYILL